MKCMVLTALRPGNCKSPVLSCLCEENISILGKKDGLIWSTTQRILELDSNHIALCWSHLKKIVKAQLQCNYNNVCLYSNAENLVKQFSPKNSQNVALWYFGHFQSGFLYFARQAFYSIPKFSSALPLSLHCLERCWVSISFALCFGSGRLFHQFSLNYGSMHPFASYSARGEN